MDDEGSELLSELDLGGGRKPRLDTLERPHLSGPLPKAFHAEYARDLTEADIVALNTLPRATRPKSLQRIHASHHALAKCLAVGMKIQQAALITGYSAGRISQLQNDEAFTALVADYRAETKSTVADQTERMINLGLDGMELLQERLHDSPESWTIPMLLDLVKAFADRTGHGPGQEVHLKMDQNFIDRPPRETIDEWKERRARELRDPNSGDSLGTPTWPTNRGYNS